MERRDRAIAMLLAAFAAAMLLLGCGLLSTGESPEDAAIRRDAAVVKAVEDYTSGKITADDCILLVLRAYGETMKRPPDDGLDSLMEIIAIAIGTAVPSAGVAVSVLNKRRNASRSAELEARDERLAELEAAIAKVQAKV